MYLNIVNLDISLVFEEWKKFERKFSIGSFKSSVACCTAHYIARILKCKRFALGLFYQMFWQKQNISNSILKFSFEL